MAKYIKNEQYNFEAKISNTGTFLACFILLFWTITLLYSLSIDVYNTSIIKLSILFLFQTYLYTGIFITAHDSMHGTVSTSKSLNDTIGKICTFLFAFFSFKKLNENHHKHHNHVGEDADPDYYEGGFFVWYFKFLKHYIGWQQLLFYAISFNVLKLFIPAENLILFWIAPAILSTFQLFYFGTYIPHQKEHHQKNLHKSGSAKPNHLVAFLSCYFFGYHYEHHEAPYVPWWQLWKMKEAVERAKRLNK